MSLSPPTEREELHHRRIDCRGYRRADGLWDIEGRLVDTKTYPFANAFRGTIEPGEALHDMSIRLTLDDRLTVVALEAVTDAGPFAACPAITPAFEKLLGLAIGPGWRRAVQSRLGGVQGCTHLVELLGPVATTAYQTIYSWRARENPTVDDDRPPRHLNTCHALRRDGEAVRLHWPKWYTGTAETGRGEGHADD